MESIVVVIFALHATLSIIWYSGTRGIIQGVTTLPTKKVFNLHKLKHKLEINYHVQEERGDLSPRVHFRPTLCKPLLGKPPDRSLTSNIWSFFNVETWASSALFICIFCWCCSSLTCISIFLICLHVWISKTFDSV